jgi:putative endonuclease
MWYVYIIECSDKSLYTGVTSDINRRLKEHNSGNGGKYTRGRIPVTLVYYKSFKSKSEALRREIQLKGWTQAKKIALIEKTILN